MAGPGAGVITAVVFSGGAVIPVAAGGAAVGYAVGSGYITADAKCVTSIREGASRMC